MRSYVPPRPQTLDSVLAADALSSLTACCVVPPRVALGVIGVLLAAFYVASNGCGGRRAGGKLVAGGVMMGRGC